MRPEDRETLSWIESYMRAYLIAPTARELAEALGLSISGARLRLLSLMRQGVLARESGRHRGLRLIGIQPWPKPKTAAEAAASRLLVAPAPPAER